MSERTRNLVFGFLIAAMGLVLVVLVATSPSDIDRVESLGTRIKCPVCQGESIANSPSQMARDMMDLIEERVAAGVDDEDIVDELLSSYSGAVLLDPPASGSTLILWLAPLAAIVIGGLVIFIWRRSPAPDTSNDVSSEGDSPRRVATILALALAFGAIAVGAGFFLQDGDGTASGIADLGEQNLDEVSNETMEAVIAANADHPQVDGMRLALAERYFEEGDYGSAFPHYLSVAESSNASGQQVITALIRLGWMAWDGNGEAEAALGLFDEALEIDPEATTAKYLKARVLWCGAIDPVEAADLYREILSDQSLTDDTRTQVEAELSTLESGGGCG